MTLENSSDSHFSGWDFLTNTRPWPVMHVVTPFNVYTITQSVWWTIFMFIIFESFETLVFLLCEGSYCVWKGGSVLESNGDSLVGDFFQGFIGLSLAYTMRSVLSTPNYSIDFRESYRIGNYKIWWKRILMLILFSVSATLANFGQNESLAWGMFVFIGVQLVLLTIFYYWNKTRDERVRSWLRDGEFDKSAYNRLYIAWAVAIAWLGSAALYKPLGYYTYVTAWVHSLVFFVALIETGLLRGEGLVITDILSLGLYSCLQKRSLGYAQLKPRSLTKEI